MLILLSAIDFLLFSICTGVVNQNGNGCDNQCDHYGDTIAYENCMKKCSSERFTTNTFTVRRKLTHFYYLINCLIEKIYLIHSF